MISQSENHVGDQPSESSRRWHVTFAGREVQHPILKFLCGAIGLLIAAAVLGVVLFVVLPAVGLIVALVLGIVAVLLLALLIGIPVLVVGALLIGLLLLPFELLTRLFRKGR